MFVFVVYVYTIVIDVYTIGLYVYTIVVYVDTIVVDVYTTVGTRDLDTGARAAARDLLADRQLNV